MPGGDVSILVEGEEGVVEEEVDEALGGKAHRARHIKDPQVWTRDANVCKQFHTDRLAISKHEMIMTWTLLAITYLSSTARLRVDSSIPSWISVSFSKLSRPKLKMSQRVRKRSSEYGLVV